jgi:ubiquinone/menaquinone biosynthesis C-methylase UbiE
VDHTDHVNLLRGGVPGPGGVWADLGSGAGAFTLALAELIGPDGHVYSVDKDAAALCKQAGRIRERYPAVTVDYVAADYCQPLDLPPLDGVVMANSLHFQRDKGRVLQLVQGYLKPGGSLILVEYNTDRGNPWVPHPLSYGTWETMARRNGFAGTRLLVTRPSRFLGEIYSAASQKPAGTPSEKI